jgi:hypothetical protein
LPPFDRLWIDCIREEAQIESRNKQKGGDDENQALDAHAWKGKGKGSGKKNTRREASPEQGKKKDLSKVKCFACHKRGHYASQCPRRKKGRGKQQASSAKVDEVADRLQRDFLLVFVLSSIVLGSGTWLVDSGASRHMAGSRESLTSLSEEDSGLQVELGDNAKYAVKGVGTTSFQLESGKPLKMSDVLYVSGLKKNLISISAMEDRGYAVAISGGQVLAQPRGPSIDSAWGIDVRDGGLYKLTQQLAQALVHDSDSLCELWHRRLGHLHYEALPMSRRMVTCHQEFGAKHRSVCKGWAHGKNAKVAFPSSDSRSKGILDLVHSNVCGPMSVPSSSDYLYYVTFIDDCSRRTWIFFMKTKYEVFSRFREFKAQVENQIGKKIKLLRSNNGGKYTSNDFRDLCKEAGFKRELTVPFNP